MDNKALFTEKIMRGAKIAYQRPGQYLFNHLPSDAGHAVANTLFDPFHKQMTKDDVYRWLDEHVIFDDNEIIGIFNGNQILWERSNTHGS